VGLRIFILLTTCKVRWCVFSRRVANPKVISKVAET